MGYYEQRDKLDELERLAKEAGFETARPWGSGAPLRLTIGDQVSWMDEAITELEQLYGRSAAIHAGRFMPQNDPDIRAAFREMRRAQRRYSSAVEAARDRVRAARATSSGPKEE